MADYSLVLYIRVLGTAWLPNAPIIDKGRLGRAGGQLLGTLAVQYVS